MRMEVFLKLTSLIGWKPACWNIMGINDRVDGKVFILIWSGKRNLMKLCFCPASDIRKKTSKKRAVGMVGYDIALFFFCCGYGWRCDRICRRHGESSIFFRTIVTTEYAFARKNGEQYVYCSPCLWERNAGEGVNCVCHIKGHSALSTKPR
jgi:hypothetical protein